MVGLFTNGLLATLSLAMGAVLLARGGAQRARRLDRLGGRNVVFSLVVGAMLLILGSYGRFTGSLPVDSPYARVMTVVTHMSGPRSDGRRERATADAERAVALHVATPLPLAGMRAASLYRLHEQRLAAFVGAGATVSS